VVADVLARAILHGYSKAVREIEATSKRRLLVAVLAAIAGTSFASIGALPEISGPDAPPQEISGRGGEGTYTILNLNEIGILAVRWEEPDYAFADGGSSGGQDVTGETEVRSITETYGWVQVEAENEGGWGWVAHGFEIYSNSIGGYSTAVYRYYVEYDDTNIGAKAWAYCRMYLEIYEWTGTSWQYVAGNNKVYDSDFSGYDELSADYDFEADTYYGFLTYAYNYAKAYDDDYARSETDPHNFVYLLVA
jgi:hypothetical protein